MISCKYILENIERSHGALRHLISAMMVGWKTLFSVYLSINSRVESIYLVAAMFSCVYSNTYFRSVVPKAVYTCFDISSHQLFNQDCVKVSI